MKVLKVALVIALVVGLVVGVVLPALAAPDETVPQPESKPRARMLKGKVSSVNATEELFTIQAGERSIDIKVSEGTRYFKLTIPPRRLVALRQHRMAQVLPESREQVMATMSAIPMKLRAIEQALSLRKGKAFRRPALKPVPSQELAPRLLAPGGGDENPKHLQRNLKWLRRFGEKATFDDIAVGDRVIVGVVHREGEPLAKLVLIIKPAAFNRVIGEVTEITEDIITITPEEGDAVELNYNGDTIFILRGTPSLKKYERAVAIYVETDNGSLAKKILQR